MIHGVILDRATGEPVPYAYVWREGAGPGGGTQASESGSWSFPFALDDRLLVSSIGYAARPILAADAAGVVYLEPTTTVLDEVEVTATRRGAFPWLLVVFALIAAAQAVNRNSRPT
jgi:hypothetical protein